jgi:hypothetical protein
MSKISTKLSALMLLILSLSFSATAQTSKGFLIGNISDPSGAAVAGASVRITNSATGFTREVTAGSEGEYRFDAIDPGTYKIEVSFTGFSTSAVNEVVVSSAQTTEAPIVLTVGGTAEVVTINSEDVVLQTSDGARVNTLSFRQITELPVAGLNPANLIFTLPGVVDPGPLAGGFVQGTEASVNGLRARANNQLLDGLDNNDNSITGQSYQPVLRDGYGEVAILSSNYSAEYGRAGGAITNVVTRSGTNRFFGSVYDVIETSALSSLAPGQKTTLGLTEVPVTIQNNYGFSIGGPLPFLNFGEGGPVVTSGRDRLFFFGSFQAAPFRGNTTANAVVPTAEGANTLLALFPNSANLAEYFRRIGNLRGTTNIRNLAPLGSLNGVVLPTITAGVAPVSRSQIVNDYQYLARIDYNPTDKDNLNFRYLADDQIFVNQFPSAFEGFGVDVPSLVQNFYFGYTRNISQKFTNEFRFGYGRFDVLFGPQSDAALQGPTIGIPGLTTTGLSSGFPQGRLFNNYQFQDTISYTIGQHSIRAGGDILVQRATQRIPINLRGILNFTTGGGFGGLRNFVEGFSGTSGTFASRVFGPGTDNPDVTRQAYFVNDNWRIFEGLSVNLGLRYEYFGEVANQARFPAFPGFDVPLQTRVEQKPDRNNFGPRVSFAYSPRFKSGFGKTFFGEDLTVIRGGFAVNYDVFFNNILSNIEATSPNSLGGDLGGAANRNGTTPRGIPNAGLSTLPTTFNPLTAPLAGVNTIDRNLVNPETYVYSLGVQRRLPGQLIAEVGYVGTRGAKLFINEQLNPGVNGIRRVPTRGSIISRTNGGDSNYNSLQARLERGFDNGLLFRLAYTFSKAIDTVNSEVFATTGGTSVGSQEFNRGLDRGLAAFDVPHRFVASFVYDIPSFTENKFGKAIFGGFTISGIYRIQSGNVESAYVGGFDLNGDLNFFNDRPSLNNLNAPATSVAILASLFEIEGGGYVDAEGNPINLADARYVVDPNIRGGIVGRNTLRGENQSRLDLSLKRAIKIPFTKTERDQFEVRVEFFNILNKPSFQFDGFQSDGDVLNTLFNRPRANFGTSRNGRIQVRYSF